MSTQATSWRPADMLVLHQVRNCQYKLLDAHEPIDVKKTLHPKNKKVKVVSFI